MNENAYRGPVVVGIDGTPAGLEALALGRVLAETLGAPLVLGAIFGYEASDFGEIVWPTARDADGWLAEAERRLRDSVAWTSVTHCAPTRAHGLVDLAEREEAGIVVLGSSRRASLGRVLAGSTARRVVNGAPCAVAVAPRDFRPGDGLQRIGAAFLDVPEAHQALAFAADLADRPGASLRAITVVYQPSPAHPMFAATGSTYVGWRVSRRQDAEWRALRALRELGRGLGAEAVVLEGDPVERLSEASEGLDLLVVGSRRYGPLRSALLGGVSGPLIEQAACPVLVVPRGIQVGAGSPEPAAAAGEPA
ncbi:MAG TPA: universal stress protein [Solirubrobacteraceae bacterium]